MINVTIIDYGAGNILSVKRGFEYWGAHVKVTDDPEDVTKAEFLVLPGVGAFRDGMEGLKARNLVKPIRDYAKKGNPFLGICLGMQMMLDESKEFGSHQGLGLIPGKVIEIEKTTIEGAPHKIPHIGWNELKVPNGKDILWWNKTLLNEIKEKESVYFVHSFTASPVDNNDRLADSYYGDRLISAVIRRGNLYGCQFHPEKSGSVGLNIIKNFMSFK